MDQIAHEEKLNLSQALILVFSVSFILELFFKLWLCVCLSGYGHMNDSVWGGQRYWLSIGAGALDGCESTHMGTEEKSLSPL